ncbi:hypothetical protein [Amycolatopsis suaedae]|uniref:DUF3558 domain-containing protein n=1 Tax=Amycolatopsis suaedae TaxID=2510978 RepID=A0A4Q7IY46_9PSEU|nr:hypothetical protein [Amycolatopsis suaedae]RZQ59359.1 hypothetical protein EWH70_34830 [Amycolatopsis suaedae]
MSDPARTTRFRLVVPAAALLLAAGCGGPDLAKSNYQRTTVPPPSQAAPDAPISDPAVASAALREAKPCGLLAPDVIGELGSGGAPEADGWDKCVVSLTDAGGKQLRFTLKVGESVASTVGKDGKVVAGLPAEEAKNSDTVCMVQVLTSRDPAQGITALVSYPGGDMCGAARNGLEKVIAKLRGGPEKWDLPKESIGTVDPCATLDGAVVKNVLGMEPKRGSSGVHECFWSGRGPTLSVLFRQTDAPTAGSKKQEVVIEGDVKGFQEAPQREQSECSLSWKQGGADDQSAEVVTIRYNNLTEKDVAKDDPCGKVMMVAKGVLAKLATS